ncbi:MAG: PilN domain-containing protein [Candidatus Paceibacterota bacterium]
MIKINLLSPFDKRNLRWEKMNNLAIRSVLWIFFAQAIFAAVFLFSLQYIKIEEGIVNMQLKDIQNQSETKEMDEMEIALATYKNKIDSIASIQKNRRSWTILFENIAELVPNGVRLESISVQEDSVTEMSEVGDLKITVIGNAKTREDLLDLESNFEHSESLYGLEYNDANYVESVDIDFNYAFYMKSEKLLR